MNMLPMDENIHNYEDENLRKVFNNYEDEPSPEVWEKINANLDKREAVYYRAKSVMWKRACYALLLLLLFFVSYEYVFKTSEKAGKEVASVNSKKKPSSDRLPAKNTTPVTQQTAASSVQKNLGRKKLLLPDKTDNTAKNKSSEHSSNENKILAEKQDGLGFKNIKPGNKKGLQSDKKEATALVNSVKKIQGQALQEADLSDKKNEKISKEQANETIVNQASPHNRNDTILSEDKTASSTKSEKHMSALLVADSNRLNTAEVNQKITIINQKKSDSIASANANVAKKTTIKLKSLFKPHWSVSPYASLDFTGSQLDDDDRHTEPGGGDERHDIKERENDQASYSFGILFRRQISKKLFLKTGFVYINSSVQTNPQTLYASSEGNGGINYKIITSSGSAYLKPSFDPSPSPGDSIEAETATSQLNYLSIPLQVAYTIHAGNRLTILPGVGFTANLLVGSKLFTRLQGEGNSENCNIVIRKLQGLDRLNFSAITDAELQYKVASKWSLFMLPSFKYAISSITKEHVVKTYPYNLSLGLGVTYGF